MRVNRVLLILVLTLSLVFSSGVSAQDNDLQDRVLVAPVLGSALLDYDVVGENGETIGGVGGLVIDSGTNTIHYISIDTDELFDSDRLVPWSAFQLLQMDFTLDDVEPAFNPESFTLLLPIDETFFDESAPAIDDSLLTDFELLSPDWDDEIGTYWSGYGEDISSTGLGDEVNLNNLFFVSGGLFDGIDFNVYNFDNELLGEVEDYVINPDGSVPFALLETDAFLDIGDELIVVSMPALVWDVEDEIFFLNVDEEVLDQAPRFDPLLIPDFRTPGWETDWNVYWVDTIPRVTDNDTDAGVVDDTAPPTVLEDELFGAEAFDLENQALGSVEALIFRGQEGLQYVVIENAETGEFHPVPWRLFNYDADTGELTFTGEASRFEEAPGFTSINQIDVSTRGWDTDIQSFWREQEDTARAEPSTRQDEGTTPSIEVNDQGLEDSRVTVDRAVSPGPGWLVIHIDENGAPGAVIGQAAVDEGVNEDVMIDVDSSQATDTLYVMLHSDTGAVGDYEFPGGDPPVRVNGEVVVVPLNILEGMVAETEEPATGEDEAMGMAVVDMIGTSFDPAEMTIQAGTQVTWSNESNLPHTVTADDGQFDSGTIQPGGEFSYTFDEPGEYPYYCELHGGPGGQGMAGVITVTE